MPEGGTRKFFLANNKDKVEHCFSDIAHVLRPEGGLCAVHGGGCQAPQEPEARPRARHSLVAFASHAVLIVVLSPP